MCVCLQSLVILGLVYLSISLPLESNATERGVYLEKNFNFDNMWDCMEASADKPSDESDESLSEEFLQDNRLDEVRETRKANRTLFKNGIVNRAGRNDKSKKKYLLLATAAIAAKAASVATALTILLPLAIKSISFLAVKSFFVGTVAILMTSFLGFSRMVQEPAEQKTVIYIHKHRKRPYKPQFRPYDHFWSDTQEIEGGY